MTESTHQSRVAEQQQRLDAHPEQAKATLRAASGGCTETDNPDLAPTLRVLQALAQCHEQTYRLYAEALGIPLDGIQVRLQAALDLRGLYAAADRIRAGFSNLQATVEISSPADIYEIERLRITVERHAPVLDIVRNPTPVRVELVLTHRKDTAPIAA
jgi:OsmC-like protein